ncbi:MAG: 50S ribosomal protein L6 [Patescibacteria group bacterium]
MSRIGKKPIEIPSGVEVKIENGFISVKGPRGELSLKLHPKVIVEKKDSLIKVSVKNPQEKKERALWGTFQRLITNMIIGVTKGYEKKLELVGLGYRASLSQNKLILNVGFSHEVEFNLPEGIEAKVEKNIITISGNDKQLVGEIAARIRKIRPPEPYKGTGIRYFKEVIRKKAGKKAVATT